MTIDEFKDMVDTSDTTYTYKDETFLAAYTANGYEFLGKNGVTYYETIDDMLNKQTIDGKLLKDCLSLVDW